MSAIDSDRPPYPEVAPCATVLGDVSAHRSMELHRRPAGRSPHSESHIRCTSNAQVSADNTLERAGTKHWRRLRLVDHPREDAAHAAALRWLTALNDHRQLNVERVIMRPVAPCIKTIII